MRWTSAYAYLAAAVLIAAVVGKVTGWPVAAVQWLLLAWAVLLLPLGRLLFRHPMRYPAWGLFLGFWGGLGLITLIVLQSLAVADVLREPARTFAEAWPLGVFAIWLGVTSLLGAPDEAEVGLAGLVCWLGGLTGLALLAAAVVGIAGIDGAVRPAFLVSAIAFVLWAAALSGEVWGWSPGLRRIAAPLQAPPALRATSPPAGEEATATP
ncbi:MAG TPA: hypothetical protein VF137_09375 [Candidatus Dormibacteraeota bacterium]